MKIITKIEYIETPDTLESILVKIPTTEHTWFGIGEHLLVRELANELVKGRRLVDKKRNLDVIVGVSGEVGEILRLREETFQCVCNERDEALCTNRVQGHAIDMLNEQMRKIKRMSVLKRLKAVFTGIPVSLIGVNTK